MATRNDVVKRLMLLSELHQRDLSESAAKMFMEFLDRYPPEVVIYALNKCSETLRHFPTVAHILNFCNEVDGRPGVEEAWSMIPKDEYGSVVWTDEMATAFGAVRMLIQSDEIAARMAFKEVYERELSDARRKNLPVNWFPSFGFDRTGRERAVLDAVERKRISMNRALLMIPELEERASINPKIEAAIRHAITHEKF